MLIKRIENDEYIRDYPVIKEYKYLGILINNDSGINKHISNIDKKSNEYFSINYILNINILVLNQLCKYLDIFIGLDYYMDYLYL